jgi:glycosyltransferase involved in cell wall biosynthesis
MDGIVVNPFDEEAFANAQVDLCMNSTLRHSLTAEAIKKVEKDYDPKSFATKLIGIYRKIC